VKLVVDANIIFSAILKGDGEVGKLLASTWPVMELHAPEALRVELALHRAKLLKISGYSVADLAIVEDRVLERVIVVPNETIPAIH